MIITSYKKAKGNTGLIAYFSINYSSPEGDRFENGLKLFMKNGHRFIIPHEQQYKNEKGENKYYKICGLIDRNDRSVWEATIIRAIDDYCFRNQIKPQENDPAIETPKQYKDD